MREKWATIVVVGAVGLGLLMYLVVYSVRVSEIAVHKRFGKVIQVVRPMVGPEQDTGDAQASAPTGVTVVPEAGWFFKLPWPFDTVEKYDQRIRLVDGRLAQIQLADEYQLIPRVYATWQITDPVAFEKSLEGDVGFAEKGLKDIIGNQTAEVFGSCHLQDVVNTDREKLQFHRIEERIFEGVKASLTDSDQAYGIEVSSLGITWVALPQGTTQAVFDRMSVERARLAEKHRAEGESDKETQIARAEAARSKTLAEAEADAKKIRAEAETEAAQYYATFAQAPNLAIFLRELEALKKITENAAESKEPITFVLTTEGSPWRVLKGDALEEGASPEPLEDVSSAVGVVESAEGE